MKLSRDVLIVWSTRPTIMASTMERAEEERRSTLTFIEEIQLHPCLWNISSAEYKDKNVKHRALDDISTKLGMKGEEDVKRKINSLRTYYNKENRKVKNSKKSGAGTDEVYHSAWTYYDVLDTFLKDQVQPRRTQSNLTQTDEEDATSETLSFVGDQDISSASQLLTSTPTSAKKSKKQKSDDDIMSCMLNLLKAPEVSTPSSTDDDLFGQVVASHMRKITEGRQKEMLKLKIQQLLVDAQFQDEVPVSTRPYRPMYPPTMVSAPEQTAYIQRSPLQTISVNNTQRSPLMLTHLMDPTHVYY